MSADGSITIKQLATRLGVSEKTIKRDISSLRTNGMVYREGADKTGLWIVVKQQ